MIGDRTRLTLLSSVPVSLMTALCPCVEVMVTLAAASTMEVTPPNMLSMALVLALTGRSHVPTSAPLMGMDRQEFVVVGSTIAASYFSFVALRARAILPPLASACSGKVDNERKANGAAEDRSGIFRADPSGESARID